MSSTKSCYCHPFVSFLISFSNVLTELNVWCPVGSSPQGVLWALYRQPHCCHLPAVSHVARSVPRLLPDLPHWHCYDHGCTGSEYTLCFCLYSSWHQCWAPNRFLTKQCIAVLHPRNHEFCSHTRTSARRAGGGGCGGGLFFSIILSSFSKALLVYRRSLADAKHTAKSLCEEWADNNKEAAFTTSLRDFC